MTRYLVRAIPVLALVAGTGCFATRGDLMVLQNDLSITRQELLRADSARRAQLDRVIASMASVNDTLRSMNQRFTGFQGHVRGELTRFGEQLITVQEQVGVSQQALQRLRADLERSRAAAAAAPPPTPPGLDAAAGTGTAAPPATATAPGPAQLLELGRSQIQRGSPGAGRSALQDLLRLYPQDDLVPEAIYFIAESYASENNMAAADSQWVQLYTRYPRAQRVPEALYRHGLFEENSGRTRQARAAYNQVIKEHPRAPAAQLARERLAGLTP